jgi:indole-3-glycerol phosphate synthase
LIAEVKLRSPASGTLVTREFDLETQIGAYAAGGAAAVSVLTEPEQFKGRLEHLERTAALLRPAAIPAMRKDFLTEPYQVLEARAAGAGGVLVILTMLADEDARSLMQCARECGLFVLLEVFDVDDLERVDALCGPYDATKNLLLGVNCRDLNTLEVRFERFADLATHLPAGWPVVAESGIATATDVRSVVQSGYRLVLAGSALMQSASPERELREWLTVGRAAARGEEPAPCS